MRRSIFTLLFFTCVSQGFSQNLITNGSFEHFITCPTKGEQVDLCTGWRMYNGNPDYYHGCNTGNMGVPVNGVGTQPAASGQAYMGLIDAADDDFREYIATSFAPLMVDATYEVSMSVSLGECSSSGSNGLGVYFFKNGPHVINAWIATVLPVTPQVSFASYGPITNKTGWVRVAGTFVADSAYTNLVIGGFLDDAYVQTSPSPKPPGFPYFYIDSVVVTLKAVGINDIANDKALAVYPNPNNGSFTLAGLTPGREARLQILNALGQVVHNDMLRPASETIDLTTHHFAPGMYTLQVYEGDVPYKIRMVVR